MSRPRRLRIAPAAVDCKPVFAFNFPYRCIGDILPAEAGSHKEEEHKRIASYSIIIGRVGFSHGGSAQHQRPPRTK